MVDWSLLNDAYGPATTIPELLVTAASDLDGSKWRELWSRLCHQGSIYSASYPAVAELEALAAASEPKQRFRFLHLAAGIVASTDHRPGKFARSSIAALLPRPQALADEALAVPGQRQADFIYLMQASLAFQEDPVWGSDLELLVDNSFVGCCSNCENHMAFFFGGDGAYATREGHTSNPTCRRLPLVGATTLPEDGQWMLARALNAGQTGLVTVIPFLFGTGTCPDCAARYEFNEAIRLESLGE